MSTLFSNFLKKLFSKKRVDKCRPFCYNIIRSGEEHKTLGPTVNLPIFNLVNYN